VNADNSVSDAGIERFAAAYGATPQHAACGMLSGTGSGQDRVLAAYRKHVSAGLARLSEFMHAGLESRSQGAYVWDERGEKYLQCGGYGVFILGHCHPRVVDAVVEQVRTLPLSTRILLSPVLAHAAQAVARVSPEGLDRVHFGVSGADAVETALKLARIHGRRRVIAMENGYHGKSLGALSVTGHQVYRDPFEPLLAGVEFVPFGDPAALDDAVRSGSEPCVILEPVQAEGGVITPPAGYLGAVERICREHGAFLVVDEIQTGLGRLGAWWGVEAEAVTPDVLLAGKALSGGVVPVSALITSDRVFEPFSRDPLTLGSTFSGAPIAMAACAAAIEAIEQEAIIPKAAALGARLRGVVASILEACCPALVREVRGAGLLLGIEWKADYLAFDFMMEMLDRRVIVAHSMNAPTVTRLTPPATLSEEDVSWLDAALRASAEALAGR
jgi:putrescine aminotransferase